MTYEEVKKVQIKNVVSNNNDCNEIEKHGLSISNIISSSREFKALAKQCLSISGASTLKDEEIVMWIDAAASDMIRQNINVSDNFSDGLIQGAIIMFVKGTFGMVDIKEKELSMKNYLRLCNDLSLSSKYKLEVDSNA